MSSAKGALVAKHILLASIQLVTYTNFRANGMYDFGHYIN